MGSVICRLRWLLRAISIDTIRDAAPEHLRRCRAHAARAASAPLVPGGPEIFLKLETLQPIGSFKIRGAANAVAPTAARRPRAAASGRSAPATPRRASRSRRAKAGAACSVHGHGHRARRQAARHRSSRRHHRQGDLRRVLAHGRGPRLRSHDRPLRPSVRRRRLHQRQRHGGARDPRGPARTSTR